MNCKKCGSPLEPNAVFCKNCGTSVDVLVPGTPGVTPVAAPVQPEVPAAPVAPATPVQPGVPAQPATPVQPMMQQQPTPGMPVQPGMQPMGTTPMMNQPAPTNGKKTNKILLIVAILVVIAAIAVVVYFVVLKKDDKPSNSNSNSGSNSNTQSNTNTNTGGNLPTNSNTGINTNTNTNTNSNTGINTNTNTNGNNPTTGNTVNHGGFTFTIPEGFIATVNGEQLVITDDNYAIGITLLSGQYEQIQMNMAQLKPSFEQLGGMNVVVKEQSINGTSYIVVSYTYQGKNMVATYSKANNTNVFVTDIVTVDGSSGSSHLSEVDSILKKATYTGKGITQNKDVSSIIKPS